MTPLQDYGAGGTQSHQRRSGESFYILKASAVTVGISYVAAYIINRWERQFLTEELLLSFDADAIRSSLGW